MSVHVSSDLFNEKPHTQILKKFIEKKKNIYIYIYIYVCMYKVNKDCEYPKNECSMHGYLIENIPKEQKYIFV